MAKAGEVQTPDPRHQLNELCQFCQAETELWQILLVKGKGHLTKYASIIVSLCGLERIQNNLKFVIKVIKDLCCRIIWKKNSEKKPK